MAAPVYIDSEGRARYGMGSTYNPNTVIIGNAYQKIDPGPIENPRQFWMFQVELLMMMDAIFETVVTRRWPPLARYGIFKAAKRAIDWKYPEPQGSEATKSPVDAAREDYEKSWTKLAPLPHDPLLVDLDGDGIETMSANDGVLFDMGGDGFAELTAWVHPDDGVLAIDRNGDGVINNGWELFGDSTPLSDGSRAASGVDALGELDENRDGRIDEKDSAFSELRVVKYSEGEGEFLERRVYTLDQLGIASISLDFTPDSTTDLAGNTRTAVANFEWSDGTSGQIAEYTLERNGTYTIAHEWLDVPDNIAELPDLPGFGELHRLQQAMVRDTTGQLTTLVSNFAEASEPSLRDSLTEQILYKWTDSESVDPGSRGVNIDARKLAVLEKFFDREFVGAQGPNPDYGAAIHLNESYRKIFEMARAELMAQTHLEDLFGKLLASWDDEAEVWKTDFSEVIPELDTLFTNDPEEGRQVLGEFARMLRGVSLCSRSCYLNFREHFVQQDPELGWIFDTGGLPVIDGVGQGMAPWSTHVMGTDNAEAVKGSLSEGDGWVNGRHGNDVVYGTARNEGLVNGDGDAILVAGAGNDSIYAGPGNDILDGGTGNDILYGEAGNDTYIFRRGSGQDTIIDPDPTPDNVDTIWLGSNLTPEEVMLRRSGDNLVLRIIGTSDSLTVRDYFRNDSVLNRVEQIQFMDGTLKGGDEAEEYLKYAA